MTVEIFGDSTYHGKPIDIVTAMRQRCHARTRDVDGYIQFVATNLKLDVVGSSVAERCDSFINEIERTGWAAVQRG